MKTTPVSDHYRRIGKSHLVQELDPLMRFSNV